MTKTFKIAVFDGDGIGPEIMHPTVALLKTLAAASADYDFVFETVPAGAAHYAKHGESLPAASLAMARTADAILLSAMGLPSVRYEDGTEISPQIEIRKALNLYAGVRPVRIVPGQPTPLALRGKEPVDFVLIRESTEGLFYSQGAGIVAQDEANELLLYRTDGFGNGHLLRTYDYRITMQTEFDEDKGKWDEAVGKAYFTDGKQTGQLKVSFFGPFYGKYIVFDLDKDNYSHAYISGGNTKYLWLLSRQPQVSDDIRNDFLAKSEAAGYDTSQLIWVEQDGECP